VKCTFRMNNLKEKFLQLLHSSDESNVALALQIAAGDSTLQPEVAPYLELVSFFPKVAKLPSNLAKIRYLLSKKVHLENQGIEYVPPLIHHLAQVRELYLDENQLITIPSEIAQLKKLALLSLHDNKLTKIPEVIFEMPWLEYLDISHNPIELETPPVGLKKMQNLSYFSIWNTSLIMHQETLTAWMPQCTFEI